MINVPQKALWQFAFGVAACAVALSAALPVVVAQQTAPAFTPRDEDVKEFPNTPGRDDTFYACTACHGFKLITQQGMTREQWDESLTWMSQRHKMPVPSAKERETILTYLATNYAPKTGTTARGWKNPFSP